MNKIISFILVLFALSCNAQKHLDSTKVVYDKDGNVFTKKYYSMKKEGFSKISEYAKLNKDRFKNKYGNCKSYNEFDFWIGDKVITKYGEGFIDEVAMQHHVPAFILKINGRKIGKFFYEEDLVLLEKIYK